MVELLIMMGTKFQKYNIYSLLEFGIGLNPKDSLRVEVVLSLYTLFRSYY